MQRFGGIIDDADAVQEGTAVDRALAGCFDVLLLAGCLKFPRCVPLEGRARAVARVCFAVLQLAMATVYFFIFLMSEVNAIFCVRPGMPETYLPGGFIFSSHPNQVRCANTPCVQYLANCTAPEQELAAFQQCEIVPDLNGNVLKSPAEWNTVYPFRFDGAPTSPPSAPLTAFLRWRAQTSSVIPIVASMLPRAAMLILVASATKVESLIGRIRPCGRFATTRRSAA